MNTNYSKRYFISAKIFLLIVLFTVGSVYSFVGIAGLFAKEGEDPLPAQVGGIAYIFLGLLAIAGAILIILLNTSRRLSDQQYEAAIASYPENIALKARTVLCIPENETLLAPAMVFEDFKYHNVLEVKHNNGRVRTDLYQKSVVFLTEKYLYTYSLTFRTVKSEEVINTEMLSYQDIVSVTLTQKNDTLRRENICIKYLEISTVGGNVIKLPYRYDEQAQQDVNMIRQIWRTKKAETV